MGAAAVAPHCAGWRMARKRMIDPSIWTDDGMAELTVRQQLLYIGLISSADDDGRLKASPVAIRLALPTVYALVKDGEIDADLTAVLRKMRKLVAYIADDRRYLVFLNYRTWQKIDKPSPSVLPVPPSISGNEQEGAGTFDDHSSNVREPFVPNRIEEKLTEEKETEPSAPSAAVPEPQTVSNITELTEERPHEMVAAFCASIGADITTLAPEWVGKQRAVAKRLIEQGYTIGKVVACAGFRQSQVWRDEPFDLFDIERGIGKWEAAGAPPRAKGRASPNGHSSNGRGPITTSDKFLVNGKEPDDEQRKRYDEADRLAFERAKARQAEAGL
jgi:hypothetical protein